MFGRLLLMLLLTLALAAFSLGNAWLIGQSILAKGQSNPPEGRPTHCIVTLDGGCPPPSISVL